MKEESFFHLLLSSLKREKKRKKKDEERRLYIKGKEKNSKSTKIIGIIPSRHKTH